MKVLNHQLYVLLSFAVENPYDHEVNHPTALLHMTLWRKTPVLGLQQIRTIQQRFHRHQCEIHFTQTRVELRDVTSMACHTLSPVQKTALRNIS